MRQAPACRSAQGSSAGFGHWRGARLCLRPKNEATFGPTAPAIDLNPQIRWTRTTLRCPKPNLNPNAGPRQRHGAWIIPYPRTHLAGSAPGSGRGLSPVHFFVILLNSFVPGTPLRGAGSGMAPCGPNGTPSRRVDRMCIFGRKMYRK